jgi:hypothetical protein
VNRVDFTRAILVGAVFESSTLNTADFTGADLRGADLRDAQLNGVIFTGATCPDGTTAGGDGCAAHLTPLATAAGSAPPAETTQQACGTVFVNGAGSDVEVDSAERILVNGAHASVTYHGTSKVLVNGAGATAHQA